MQESFFKNEIKSKKFSFKDLTQIIINLIIIILVSVYFYHERLYFTDLLEISLSNIIILLIMICLDILAIVYLQKLFLEKHISKKINFNIFLNIQLIGSLLSNISSFLSFSYKYFQLNKKIQLKWKNFLNFQLSFSIINLFVLIFVFLFSLCFFVFQIQKYFLMATSILVILALLLNYNYKNKYIELVFGMLLLIFLNSFIFNLFIIFFTDINLSINMAIQIWSGGSIVSIFNIFGLLEFSVSYLATLFEFNFKQFFMVTVLMKICYSICNLILLILIFLKKFFKNE